MKPFLVVVLFLIANSSISQNVEWAMHAGTETSEVWSEIELDSYGNIYALFRSSYGNFQIDNTSIPNSQANTGHLVKMTSDGEVIWTRQIGGDGAPNAGQPFDLAVDFENNVIVAGYYLGSIQFDSVPHVVSGGADAFLVKYDEDGNYLWSRSGGGTSEDRAIAVDCDNQGNTFVTGIFQGLAQFGTTTLTGTATLQMFLIKYNSVGGLEWSLISTGSGLTGPQDIAVNQKGEIYLCGGSLSSTMHLDTVSVPNAYGFITKINHTGSPLWAFPIETSSGKQLMAIDTDDDGYVYGIGRKESIDTGPTIMEKRDASGNVAWSREFTGQNFGNSIDINYGRLYIGGNYSGSLSVDGLSVVSEGSVDCYFARVDPNTGDALWISQIGGTEQDGLGATEISSNNNCELYFSNSFNVLTQAGDTIVSSYGSNDILFGKIIDNNCKPSVNSLNKPFESSAIAIYPNPVTHGRSKLNLNLARTQNPVGVSVHNIVGECVFRRTLIGEKSIDISNLNRGTYSVTIQNSKESFSQRLIIL